VQEDIVAVVDGQKCYRGVHGDCSITEGSTHTSLNATTSRARWADNGSFSAR